MDKLRKDFVQIDIMLLLRRIWESKLIIVLTTLVFTAGALMYSLFIATPKYNSTTRAVYVVNQKKTPLSLLHKTFNWAHY